MAKKARGAKKGAAKVVASKGGVIARAYTSPTLVLLAMDWPDGAKFDDFLGFSILRAPGFHPGEKDGFLFNKISFSPPTDKSQPLPSNLAPFQKFMWWDAGINDKDRGKTFTYTITPVRGTGPTDLKPVTAHVSGRSDVSGSPTRHGMEPSSYGPQSRDLTWWSPAISASRDQRRSSSQPS